MDGKIKEKLFKKASIHEMKSYIRQDRIKFRRSKIQRIEILKKDKANGGKAI